MTHNTNSQLWVLCGCSITLTSQSRNRVRTSSSDSDYCYCKHSQSWTDLVFYCCSKQKFIELPIASTATSCHIWRSVPDVGTAKMVSIAWDCPLVFGMRWGTQMVVLGQKRTLNVTLTVTGRLLDLWWLWSRRLIQCWCWCKHLHTSNSAEWKCFTQTFVEVPCMWFSQSNARTHTRSDKTADASDKLPFFFNSLQLHHSWFPALWLLFYLIWCFWRKVKKSSICLTQNQQHVWPASSVYTCTCTHRQAFFLFLLFTIHRWGWLRTMLFTMLQLC